MSLSIANKLRVRSQCILHHVRTTFQQNAIGTIPCRWYWREVLRIKSYNPKAKTNKIIYEDPSVMAERSSRAQAGEGLLQRKGRFRYYIKPWMKRKRLKEVKKYKSMESGVNNLKKYVHFINDYKKKHF